MTVKEFFEAVLALHRARADGRAPRPGRLEGVTSEMRASVRTVMRYMRPEDIPVLEAAADTLGGVIGWLKSYAEETKSGGTVAIATGTTSSGACGKLLV